MARCLMESPVGALGLRSDGHSLTRIEFDAEPLSGDLPDEVLDRTVAQLTEYFAGQRTLFDLPLAPTGTEFQLGVWKTLQQIPYGQTVTYGQIAWRLGQPPGTARAVGAANGSNPIPIVVPCHRVIGADGRLTGYGGGLERKRLLLGLESPTLF